MTILTLTRVRYAEPAPRDPFTSSTVERQARSLDLWSGDLLCFVNREVGDDNAIESNPVRITLPSEMLSTIHQMAIAQAQADGKASEGVVEQASIEEQDPGIVVQPDWSRAVTVEPVGGGMIRGG